MAEKSKPKADEKPTDEPVIVDPEVLRAKMIAAIHANNTAMSKAFRAGIQKGAHNGND